MNLFEYQSYYCEDLYRAKVGQLLYKTVRNKTVYYQME